MDAENPDDDSRSLRDRAGIDGRRLWFQMEADRLLVVAVFSLLVFAALVAVGIGYPKSEAFLRDADSADTAFQALLAGTITGVTVVLSLNQLVLSEEFGELGEQRERMEEAVSFRDRVEAVIGADASPVAPSAFLGALLGATAARADALRETLEGVDDDPAAEIRELATALSEDAGSVENDLDDATFGTFAVVSASLDFAYDRRLYEARRLGKDHADDLPEETTDALDELVEALRLYAPAREHFKTFYFRWELIHMSQVLLATALPAVVVAVSMIVFVDPQAIEASVAGVDLLVLLICGAVTVTLLPFAVLLAYMLRLMTVTQHTLSVGPFVLRE